MADGRHIEESKSGHVVMRLPIRLIGGSVFLRDWLRLSCVVEDYANIDKFCDAKYVRPPNGLLGRKCTLAASRVGPW